MNGSLRTLVVDDIGVMRLLVRNNLRAMGIENSMLAANGREAVELLKQWRFDLVLTDWNMPLMDGLELLTYIRQSERHRDVPVILITAEGDRDQVRHAIDAGVSEFLIKPFTLGTFERKVQRAIDGTEPPPLTPDEILDLPETAVPRSSPPSAHPHPGVFDAAATILAVDDIADNIRLITSILKDDYRVKGAKSGAKALQIARSDEPPHLILLDIMMPEMDGLEVCRQLKSDPRTRDIPIIFLTVKAQTEDVIAGLELGAVDYVTKPANPPVLKARIRTHLRLSRQQNELREQSALALEHARLREEIERMARHDIKNPLNALLALTHALAGSDNLLPDQRESVSAMEESAQYVLDMVNHSLALQRMEMGVYQLAPVEFSISDLLAKVIAETRAAFGALQVDIRQPSSAPLMVRGETLLCHALFSNLIRNAAEAAPRDSPIRIEIEPDFLQVRIAIHNQGAVPAPVRDTFFEKYATSGKKQGTGIGTYSAKLMAETQGGRIDMETADDTGTTVSVTLPAA
ncbi:response regulator [Thiocystis violascens]|uniref:histidine kinase n=1 Tax=Thiocystis violascens (strain ATCC 17096 / DSM 198 / 6111) TaxID=765911 RepID=I3Y8A9_THIV6|nr:response regulator [Thiocystis violascens]AFL73227.1 response regulator containing a CheY-like receiver domain and a GGDEF domain [Thiocystis violascens DSM 198]